MNRYYLYYKSCLPGYIGKQDRCPGNLLIEFYALTFFLLLATKINTRREVLNNILNIIKYA